MSGGVTREALTLAGPAGHIEALLEYPPVAAPAAVAVICHPHPLHQGTMQNKVVHTLSRVANDLSVPAVRFNFWGVGASEGDHGEGHGEVDDVLAVAAWARDRYPGAALWLAGFSFGAAVAIGAARQLGASRLVSIAPPVRRMASLTDGARPGCPWLVVQGDADGVVPCDEVRHWVAGLKPAPDLAILPGVDHFFHGRLTVLRATVAQWLQRRARLNPSAAQSSAPPTI